MTDSVRNPQDRRLRIVEAAAQLLTDGTRVTHRNVAGRASVPLGSTTYYFASLDDLVRAAVEHLSTKTDQDLAEVRRALARSDGSPGAVAELMHEYLRDAERVQTEMAIYAAGIERPELREVSRRWFAGLVTILSDYTDTRTAQLLAVFGDGVTLHASLHDEPLEIAALEHFIALLLNSGDGPGRTAHLVETEKP